MQGSYNSIIWNNEEISRYILGTAQLGSNYGIANTDGQPNQLKANQIIDAAWNSGARFFDTARNYGESELILRNSLNELNYASESRVITKISAPDFFKDYSWVRDSVETSLRELSLPSLWSVLLHRYNMLELWDEGLGESLLQLKEEKKISYLGVSVYSAEEIRFALDYRDIDIIQAPCNLWSPEPLTLGLIKKARSCNKLVIARSIFLQGLMLLKPEFVLAKLPEAYSASLIWHEILKEYGVDAWELSMRFASYLDVPVILGAENAGQASSNGKFMDMIPLDINEIIEINNRLAPYLSDNITNPSKWK